MSAASATASTALSHGAEPGSTPRAALQPIEVRPIPMATAKQVLLKEHYLHSLPGGTRLAFGAFLGHSLLGAVTLGAGPFNAHRLVDGALPDNCMCLTRLWLADRLPKNSESRVLGIVFRSLKQHTASKFLVTYADPAQGHVGTIYQATNWLYTGLSEAMPYYDLGDGQIRHSRSLSHAYGSHSVKHFNHHGVGVKVIKQAGKHRYLYFLDTGWEHRLRCPVLPYPKTEVGNGSDRNSYRTDY